RAFQPLSHCRLCGDLTAIEVMWNEYYRLTTELVKGVAAPLPTNHPFYVLLESSGSDAERIRSDLEEMLETALEDDIILDATIASSGAAAAAIWKIRDSSVELGRARHRHFEAALFETQPHRGGDRDHAHAQARAGPASHPQSRAYLYDLS